MALYLATAFLPALRLCRKWKPDVVHAHFVVPTGALALSLRWFAGVPFVLTAHLGDVPGGVPEQTDKLFRWLGPFIRPIWKNAAAVTAVSGFVAELAERTCGVSAKVILNGVPMLPNPPRIELQNPLRLVMVGRLSVQKNPLLAVRALALVKDLSWRLEVIGEGPLGTAMREEVEKNGLADRVEFSGWLSAEQVSERLGASDILLMTSTSEGLPMAGIEALRYGLAIVGSKIGGLMDVVADGSNGLLCDLEPEAFSTGLRSVLENPSRLAGMRAASLAKAQEFSLPERLDDYERVLESAAR
jgi:glycosyltransferase involved in cell wall biosynthesis